MALLTDWRNLGHGGDSGSNTALRTAYMARNKIEHAFLGRTILDDPNRVLVIERVLARYQYPAHAHVENK